MSNTILTPSIIAKEALMQLEENLVMAGLVHRDYSKEFVNVGDTITVKKPAKFVAKNFLGQTEDQNLSEGSIPVKMDRYRDITIPITSKEMTLSISDFSEQVVKPAMKAIAQAIDQDLLDVGIQNASNKVAISGTPAISDLAGVGRALDKKKAPRDNLRHLVLGVDTTYKYNTLTEFTDISASGSSEALRDSTIGKAFTMNTYMSQNVPASSAETPGTCTALKVKTTKGTASLVATNITPATAKFEVGDQIIVNGYTYTVKTAVTAASGSATISTDEKAVETIETAVDAMPITKEHSLGFHRNGLALVTRALELPAGAAKAAIESENGLAVRVVFGYDQDTKTDKISFDIIYGVKNLNDDLLVDFA